MRSCMSWPVAFSLTSNLFSTSDDSEFSSVPLAWNRLLKRIDVEAAKFTLYFLGYEKESDIPADESARHKWTFTRKAVVELTQYVVLFCSAFWKSWFHKHLWAQNYWACAAKYSDVRSIGKIFCSKFDFLIEKKSFSVKKKSFSVEKKFFYEKKVFFCEKKVFFCGKKVFFCEKNVLLVKNLIGFVSSAIGDRRTTTPSITRATRSLADSVRSVVNRSWNFFPLSTEGF